MPSPTDAGHAADLDLALRAALAGARVALPYFARVQQLTHERKSDGTIVTEADRAVERTVLDMLLTERPDDASLGEETGEHGSGPRRWILDGIDGTAVFVRGDDSWQSLVALEIAGEIVVGVAILPARGQVWWAARGHGAYVADVTRGQIRPGRRLMAHAGPRDLDHARLGIVPEFAALPPARRALGEPLVAPLIAAHAPQPWSVHPALLVASGDLDVAVQVLASVWDFAALSVIVEESGGQFSDPDGRGHPVVGTGIFSATASLHQAVLPFLR